MSREWLRMLDSYANETYGFAITSAIVAGSCVSCGEPARMFSHSDGELTYIKTGVCEACQRAQESIADKIIPFNQNYRQL